ncbi:hypothetical protein EG328_007052 [Venturia inaequalis]|uniref:Uncharacterized protein n=1 Tax=Venturia inaequalis TaxID=5025 RepID=A0A8H3ZAY5_VENIN|nr:hypothetical protein EG328_007052 [Venturia inaequalis]KAE9992259.1 hypothetical protein EG327_009637 [Venturia inaequalis]
MTDIASTPACSVATSGGKKQVSKFISLPSEIKHKIIGQIGSFGDVKPVNQQANANRDPDSINQRIVSTNACRESDGLEHENLKALLNLRLSCTDMLDHANESLDINYMLNWVTIDYDIPSLQRLRLLSQSRNKHAVKLLNISTTQPFGSYCLPVSDYSTVSPIGMLNGMTLLLAALRGFPNLTAIRFTGQPSVRLLKQPRFVAAMLPLYSKPCTSETHFQRVVDSCTAALRRSSRQITHLYIQDEGIMPTPGPLHSVTCFSWLEQASEIQRTMESQEDIAEDQSKLLQRLLDLQQAFEHVVSVKYIMSLDPRIPIQIIPSGVQYIPDFKLRMFLNQVPRLQRLSLTISNYLYHSGPWVAEECMPYFGPYRFWDSLNVPRLESLEINAPILFLSDFSRVIVNHVDTLRRLTLREVMFPRQDCWKSLAGVLRDCRLERIVIDMPLSFAKTLYIGVGEGRATRVVVEGDVRAGLDAFVRDLNS